MAALSELSADERIIIVMGPTGVGKTTFINCISNRGGRGVGHNIESCTSEVSLINVGHTVHGRKVVLVDTPGFDDTYTSDIEILTKIASFLVKVFKKNLKLDKILYLHRITDQRMTGSLLKNLKLFVSLCGIQSMPTVTIVTTMWKRVEELEGETRELELKQKMWFDMIEKGCDVKRFDGTYQSALDILAGPRTAEAPLVSTEIVTQQKKLKATAAANELAKEIKNLIKQRKAASRKLQALSQQSTLEEEKKVLEQELNETNQKIITASEQHAVLKRNLFERLFGPKPEASLVPQLGSTSLTSNAMQN
ncbi:hypothetical protein FRC14_002832 [Serendipita sp. 396]|nr:hypothetical protein FRC14_002832 [Serendipita sp. 396]KAG8784659.1 hypothetical protein FRC15_002885 [Serendipita sp. 397]KAG8800337.1 hypothetical protein FRC16_003104 [Serendipita sp. 398]KAG8820209.1 hypothetical protein FRC19_009069 [Serendipita sp. 401]KAG8832684.1 hypothetical protein FRC18_004732 [Serendipita sp. 400]KAG8852777.1 hypothetical protein FRB91_005940 [Serendipita sp. 411]KAG8868123.1 hypothetical protein FRC20_004095 [Serendipita sp. 405]KAG9054140.1 hypothetical prot